MMCTHAIQVSPRRDTCQGFTDSLSEFSSISDKARFRDVMGPALELSPPVDGLIALPEGTWERFWSRSLGEKELQWPDYSGPSRVSPRLASA